MNNLFEQLPPDFDWAEGRRAKLHQVLNVLTSNPDGQHFIEVVTNAPEPSVWSNKLNILGMIKNSVRGLPHEYAVLLSDYLWKLRNEVQWKKLQQQESTTMQPFIKLFENTSCNVECLVSVLKGLDKDTLQAVKELKNKMCGEVKESRELKGSSDQLATDEELKSLAEDIVKYCPSLTHLLLTLQGGKTAAQIKKNSGGLINPLWDGDKGGGQN